MNLFVRFWGLTHATRKRNIVQGAGGNIINASGAKWGVRSEECNCAVVSEGYCAHLCSRCQLTKDTSHSDIIHLFAHDIISFDAAQCQGRGLELRQKLSLFLCFFVCLLRCFFVLCFFCSFFLSIFLSFLSFSSVSAQFWKIF